MERDALLNDLHEEQLLEEDIVSFAEQHGLEHKLDLLLETASCFSNGNDSVAHSRARSKWKQPFDLYCVITATALGATIQGWAQTGMNGATLQFPKLFGISPLMTGLINSAIYLSNGVLGSWLVAPLNGRIGRRGATFVGTVIALVFNIASSTARNWQTMLSYRLALGIGLGVINSTLNIFAAECSPPVIRGGLGVAWQMFCAFGIFLGFLTNMNIEKDRILYGGTGWRLMLLAAAIPTIPLLLLIFYCPESPTWHIKNDNYGKAFEELHRLRGTEREAAKDILITHFRRRRSPDHNVKSMSVYKVLTGLCTVPRNRRAAVAAYTTQVAQQLCGINIVAFYSSTIFVQAKFTSYSAMIASTVFGLVNWLGAFPAIWTIDSLGRRALLLYTLPLMAMAMAAAGFGFTIGDANVRLGVTAGMIYLFCLIYSPGMGPVPAAYSAEVFPSSYREIGASSAIALTNLLAAVLSLTFPWLLNRLGTAGSFLLYATLNIVAWVLVFLLVPETKQKSLEDLDEVFAVPTRTFVNRKITTLAPAWSKRYTLWPSDRISGANVSRQGEYAAMSDDETLT